MYAHSLTLYILEKTGWTRETFEQVDWKLNKTSFNTKTMSKKFNLCKFIHK